tara:strand:+ start:563 stop:769 length:207 start_codon:yes stop_codon:yes gene_type:complete
MTKALIAHIMMTNLDLDWLRNFETVYEIAEDFMMKHPSLKEGVWNVETEENDFESAAVYFARKKMYNR